MIVVDASAMIDALAGARTSDALGARLRDVQLHAPELVDYEFVAGLRSMTMRGELSEDRAGAALADFDVLPISRWAAVEPLRHRAYALRDNLSAYDAAYVALAELLDCPLITRDERLARAGGHDATVIVG